MRTDTLKLLIPAAACIGLVAANLSAQDACLPSPLFSGNVVLRMPPIPTVPSSSVSAWSMVLGDLDRDSHLDILYGTDYGSLVYFRGSASWWEFDPPVVINLPFATPPPGGTWLINALATADCNEDGDRDLVIGDTQGSGGAAIQRIHVMLGNGDGTFQPATAWGPNIVSAIDFAIADFDGDDNLDIMCGTLQTTFTVIWGAGDGTFPMFNQVATGLSFTDHVDAADIDLDGDVDAVLDHTQAPDLILRNNGDGTFAQEQFAVTSLFAFGETFGLLNGDAWPDMVVAHTSSGNESVYVLINDGTGHFPMFVQYPITSLPQESFVGSKPLVVDLDGDARLEIIIRRASTCSATGVDDQLLVFHNAGNGTYQQPPALHHMVSHYAASSHLASGDLNHDGNLDVISANSSRTTLLLNDGGGGFFTNHGVAMGQAAGSQTAPCGQLGPATAFSHVTPGDVNNDGSFDLVGVRENTGSPFSFLECTVMLQDAQGAFTTLHSVPLPERYTAGLALADFDLDDNLDIVVSTQTSVPPDYTGGKSVRIALGNGDGTFDPWVTYQTVGYSPQGIAVGDLNGDEWPDLVVPTAYGPNYPSSPDPRGVSVFLNGGNGTMGPPTQYDTGMHNEAVAIADLDGDGNNDIGVAGWVSGFHGAKLLMNSGNGTFSLGPLSYHYRSAQQFAIPGWITLADVNSDDRPDMFVDFGHNPYDYPYTSGGMVLALNSGDGSFQPGVDLDLGTLYGRPVLCDFNNDMKVDLARYDANGVVAIGLGNDDGTFGPRILYGGVMSGLIVHDFDNDGRPDIGSPKGCSPDSDSNAYIGFSILLNRMCPAPPPAPCPADITGDQTVNVLDLLALIGQWGACADPTPGNCPADLTGDGVVNVGDLLNLIGNWGACP
ncbi:MAG: FG-GAP-like repeat-containing protein [Phycisphaerales bacterium]|nr:FG-GAP-like repeat-containing protein [Phycisphaerales bacterium]MCI0631257.1 FG-GAP-like repeat-containing protein [Phycisphaerales bacterium]